MHSREALPLPGSAIPLLPACLMDANALSLFLWVTAVTVRPKNACYYITPEKTAIIELAAICGLKDLEKREYDITHADTAGL